MSLQAVSANALAALDRSVRERRLVKTTRQSRSISTRRTKVETYPVVGSFAADTLYYSRIGCAYIVVAGHMPGSIRDRERIVRFRAL